MLRSSFLAFLIALLPCAVPAAESRADLYRFGAATRLVNPDRPTVVVGFDAKVVLENRLSDLTVACSIIEDSDGNRLAILSADVMEFLDAYAASVIGDISRRFHIPAGNILLNASHSHSSPPIDDSSTEFPDKQFQPDYAARFREQLIAVVGDALADLQPARLRLVSDYAAFSVNRRRAAPAGGITNVTTDLGILFAPNPGGSIDPAVQAIAIEGPTTGTLRAVILKFACHPTTMNQVGIGGDYICAFRQHFISRHPGLHAQFLQGCAGDVKTYSHHGDPSSFPKGTPAMASGYGLELAEALDRALARPTPYLAGPIETRTDTINLPITPLARADHEAKLAAEGWWDRRWARQGLARLDAGETFPAHVPMRSLAVRIGRGEASLLILALGAELFSGYSHMIQRRVAPVPAIVLGYTGGMAGYLPTAEEIPRGGYEIEIFRWWNNAGPFTPAIEPLVLDTVTSHAIALTRAD